ncbi:hypothetical protein BGW38_005952 [Lunasporangiospora selenospora]|uniref:Major Facilitator Superfamily protein n=1 Tax=Lunasporangiospora selenospora TaxID=979761 RepID=A0A9P6G0I0_9FUNG|nr:hypothetical protein BGW38_005952 [Lunasporangiospora selenospora]
MTDNPWRRVPERNEPDAPEVIPLLSDTEDDDDDIRGAPITSTSGFTPPPTLQNDDQEEAEWLASLQRRKWYKRPSIFWLMPFLMIFITILSMVDGPTEQLGIQLICRDYFAGRLGNPVTTISSGPEIVLSLKEPDDRCKSPEVIAVAARILSQVQGVRGALTLLTLAKWTSLSDTHGRKLLVRVAMLASICSQSLLIFAPTVYNPLGAKVLYVNGALMGLAGGYNLVSPALFAYIADCTSTATRSINMGFTSISAAVGGMIGSYLGGYITKTSGDLTLVNRIALGCLCLLSVYFILVPESKRQSPPPSEAVQGNVRDSILSYLQSQKQRRTPFGLIKSILKSILGPLLLFAPGEVPVSSKVPTRQTLLLLLATRSLVTSASTGLMVLFIPLTNLLFHWTAYDDGIYYSFMGACGLVTYTIVFPILQFVYKKYNPYSSHSANQMAKDVNEDLPQNSDTNTDSVENALDEDLGEQIGASSSVNTLSTVKMDLAFYIMGLVTFFCSCLTALVFRSVPALFVCEALFQIATIGSTAFMSMLTTMVPSNQTGRALGAVSVVDTLSSTIATLVYGAVFAAMSKTMPWSHYFISVGLAASAVGIAAVVWTQFRYRGQILLDV